MSWDTVVYNGMTLGDLISPDWLISILGNLAVAGLILIVALFVSGWVRRRIVRIAYSTDYLDNTLFAFLGSLARYGIIALAIVFVLNRFGIQTTSLVALIGAMGLAIGLALQGTLSNIAAGVMLVIFRPFKVGDFILAAGHSGTVQEITLFTTELATPDNVQIIVPNGAVWGSAITNYSTYNTRRAEWIFGVSYTSDLKKAEQIIRDTILGDPRALADPEPFVQVNNLGDSSVDFLVRVWCKRADMFGFQADMKRAVKEAFDAGGIDIPFPTSVVYRQDAS